MSVLFDHIRRETYTVERARACLALLERVLTKALYTDEATTGVAERFSAALAEVANETPELLPVVQRFGTDWLGDFTMENLASRMRAVAEEVAAAPALKLYLPVALSVPGEAIIGEWLRAELPAVTFFDAEVDTAFIGGCGVVVNGQLHDYSLGARLKANPAAVGTVIQAYVNT